ncbi:MAG: right-handed parallel beta-helix repeat-containing protein [Planctomycetota bacterium]|jgi:hypothetical protein
MARKTNRLLAVLVSVSLVIAASGGCGKKKSSASYSSPTSTGTSTGTGSITQTGTGTGSGTLPGSETDPTGGFADSGTYLNEIYVETWGDDYYGDGTSEMPYGSISKALSVAKPGDKLLLGQGWHMGGAWIQNLKGTARNPIMIAGDPAGGTYISGGTNCIQLCDAEYVVIQDIICDGADGNGLNIDDAGTFDTPSHHIVIRRVHVRFIGSGGNQDGIKMSGVEYFLIDECEVHECGGPYGGSGIDMCGCHHGTIRNSFLHKNGHDGCQMKAGCENILIWRNRFTGNSERALNLGGGSPAGIFRPQGATYEARNIRVIANLFYNQPAPAAYVSSEDIVVANNTIYLPKYFIIRILQESSNPACIQCRNGHFYNNIIVFRDSDLNYSIHVNIGPDTQPETFSFANNLWYCLDDPSFTGPNLPAAETGGIYQQDPLFADPASQDFHIPSSSPAYHNGMYLDDMPADYNMNGFDNPPSIGALEAEY